MIDVWCCYCTGKNTKEKIYIQQQRSEQMMTNTGTSPAIINFLLKFSASGRVLLPEDWHPSLGEAPEVLAEWSFSNTSNAAETGTGALLAKSL